MRGRFAPSPTGAMHLGNARTALLAWLAARQGNGTVVLRVEDLDQGRVMAGAEARLLDELRWLGLDWDEGPDVGGPHTPYRQSERKTMYDSAIARLVSSGRAFPCACSRSDVGRAASAPHEGADGDGPRYPGTCARRDPGEVEARGRAAGRRPAIRFRGQAERWPFVDEVRGAVDPLGEHGVDDFVLQRADGVASYQLAVAVDDGAMGIAQVVRGDDLLRSTPRQLALGHALGLYPPRYAHVPLVLSAEGERLAKRDRPRSVGDLRAEGVAPQALIGALAASVGLCPPGTQARPRDLLGTLSLPHLSRQPAVVDPLLPSNRPTTHPRPAGRRTRPD